MRPSSIERPEDDVTLQLLDEVIDGSIAGLAIYHLMKMQMEAIRGLPERLERDRRPVSSLD
jgi:hypothetical protein